MGALRDAKAMVMRAFWTRFRLSMADILPPGVANGLLPEELPVESLARDLGVARSSPVPSLGAPPVATEEPLFLPSPPPPKSPVVPHSSPPRVVDDFIRVESSPSKRGSEVPARESEQPRDEGDGSKGDSEEVVEEENEGEKEEKEKAKPWVS